MALWGSLFTFIKIGYNAFSISGSDTASILMFAGIRFAICGAIICLVAFIKKDKIVNPKGKSIISFLIIGFFAIILHYAFTYIGLSMTDSSKSALIKQLGSLLYVCFAFLFFKEEKFSTLKIVGALIGFAGIVAINLNGGKISFTLGDILIISASFCTVASAVISKRVLTNNSPFWLTGISQLSGGIVLVVVALIMGANFLSFDWIRLGVFAYICTASIFAYVLWNYILRTGEISNMFIIKFSEPIFACIFGALLLNENILKWQYLVAFILVSAGIVIANVANKKQKKKAKDESENI